MFALQSWAPLSGLTFSLSLPCSSPTSLLLRSRSCWSVDCCSCDACRRDDSSASFSLTDRNKRSFSACRAVIELFICSDVWWKKINARVMSEGQMAVRHGGNWSIQKCHREKTITGYPHTLTISLLWRVALTRVTSAIFSSTSLLNRSTSNFCSSNYRNSSRLLEIDNAHPLR